MRICIGISVVIHAVLMLWLMLGPGATTFAPASAEAILVDLVPPQDTHAAEQPKSEQLNLDQPKPEEAKPDQTKTALETAPAPTAAPKPEPKPKPESSKHDSSKPEPPPQANQKPQPKGDSKTAAEERAAAAARIAWMLNLPTDTEASLAAPPSEEKSNLSREEIADFKAQVSKCWVVPEGVPTTPGFNILVRIALSPDGRLGAKPQLIRAPASDAGPPLVESAKQALQQCQPYGGLPADKYRDWKILDLTFTAQGPYALSGPPARRASAKP